MTPPTQEMLAARIALQDLSAGEPSARANILRQLSALTTLVTGRRNHDDLPGEPMFLAGFQLTAGEQRCCMRLTARSLVEQIYLAFDIDDAAGAPRGLGVVTIDGDRVVMHLNCRLWSSVGGGRALIVPTGEGARGHFAFRRGERMRFTDGPPPGDLAAGFKRAEARMRKLADELALRQLEGAITRYRAQGRDMFADVEPIAA